MKNRHLEIYYGHHNDIRYEESAVYAKSDLNAIIIPGLSFGIIIWAAQLVSDQCLIISGFVGMRAILFPVMALVVTPLLLVIAGIASETLRKREGDTRRALSIPYAAGFLAMGLAFLLFRIVSSVNQYLPYMAPGILPRLAYVTGNLTMYLPIHLAISTLFAFFSLAGGWYMHRKTCSPDKRRVTEKIFYKIGIF